MSEHTIKRIALLGPESSGKTTLARQLAEHYGTVWVPEYLRTWCDQHQRLPRAEDVSEIAQGQCEQEEAIAAQANQFLFCDTCLIASEVYARHYFNTCPTWIVEHNQTHRYEHILLMSPDIEWEPDPQREGDATRPYFLKRFQDYLKESGQAFSIIRGQGSARFDAALRAIQKP